jgi:hypothetical protein
MYCLRRPPQETKTTEVWKNEVSAVLSPESMDMLVVRVFTGISNEIYDLYPFFQNDSDSKNSNTEWIYRYSFTTFHNTIYYIV